MTTKKPQSLDQAVESLAQSFGFDAHYEFAIGDETFRITYKQFLPADVQRGLDAIDIQMEQDCDRNEDGDLLIPLRHNGEPLEHTRDALRLQLIWGVDKYERFKAAGGSPDLLSIVWLRQETDLERYQKSV